MFLFNKIVSRTPESRLPSNKYDLLLCSGDKVKLIRYNNTYHMGVIHSYNESEIIVRCSKLWPPLKNGDLVRINLLNKKKLVAISGHVKFVSNTASKTFLTIRTCNIGFEQRRKYPRIDIDLVLFYAPVYLGKDPTWSSFMPARMLNLSVGGIKFDAVDCCIKNTSLCIMFDVMSYSEIFYANVVRAFQKDNGCFEIAVNFDRLKTGEKALERLARYIDGFLDSKDSD